VNGFSRGNGRCNDLLDLNDSMALNCQTSAAYL
jgi:hypothetical protein